MKEKFLTILVPIKPSDVTATYASLAALDAAVTPDIDNINNIYTVTGDGYYRSRLNEETEEYEFVKVYDREFPYLGNPIEIYDFTYDATRMGTAPTITAQGIMWYAEKDENGNDVTLEGLWSQQCHVSFNGENFYLKQIPTSKKANDDARYKYDIDFVSERFVLETVYLYDVVQPFITERQITESSSFSFYGDINELAKRINASLLRSGLASLAYRDNQSESVHPRLLSDNVTHAADDQYFSYEEWNSISVGTYNGPLSTRDPYNHQVTPGTYDHWHNNIYDHYNGDYNAYLRNEVYLPGDDDGLTLSGYKCRIGKDKKGVLTTSDEKLVVFENNTIHEALQHFHDDFELQYYIYREKNQSGVFTGNTIIMVADCEHDFADVTGTNPDGSPIYSRDAAGLPTTEHPFDYGVDDALLSKEKNNTTEKIITRITGVGGTENIPWYYPNPTGDGWIKPVYKTNGDVQSRTIDYPTSEGTTVADSVLYEKYLKNRIGNVFKFGRKILGVKKSDTIGSYSIFKTSLDETQAILCYEFQLTEKSLIKSTGFTCTFPNNNIDYILFKDNVDITGAENRFLIESDGSDYLTEGNYNLIIIINFNGEGPSPVQEIEYYYYPQKNAKGAWNSTWKVKLLFQWLLGLATIQFTLADFLDFIGKGFDCTIPGFLSTNPNLKYHEYSRDAKQLGWYDGNTRISPEDMVFGDPHGEYYVFEGGSGEKQVGKDDIFKVKFSGLYSGNYVQTHNLQFNAVDPNNPLNVAGFILDCAQGLYNGAYIQGEHRERFTSIDSIEEVDVNVEDFINNYVTFSFDGYIDDGWYKSDKKVELADYGITNEYNLTLYADVYDTIEFRRVKYVTPQPNLLPEVYIKTDGERRFYNAHDYWDKDNNTLYVGTADTAIGEVQSGTKVKNPLYKENETDTDDKHYDFENEFIAGMPKEHIENFDDVKPSIQGQTTVIYTYTYVTQYMFNNNPELFYTKNNNGEYVQCHRGDTYSSSTNYYTARVARIDVVEEFQFDYLDNDEIWESDTEDSGEYKHPFFFAKLRPLGFNIFDMALQEDMVLSMTTGHCGACNFRIGVDENTKKNPVQIWEYNVYGGPTYASRGDMLYEKGTLRRYVSNSSNLYYDTDGTADGYILAESVTGGNEGFLVYNTSIGTDVPTGVNVYNRTVYNAAMISNGEVGSLKQNTKKHIDGDVKVNGRYIESQQDTSENFVWIALYKDTDTYGTLMPSARPTSSYEPNSTSEYNPGVYIEPKGRMYTNRNLPANDPNRVTQLSDDNADKFVFVNIRMPQAYLRRAERDLSRKLIAYMYDNNYQKFNFTIGFSRIFLAQNESIDDNLNENSVLYVTFNNRIYRQYVKHYTYKMSRGESLPEITVDMNEELNVTRTQIEQQAALQTRLATRTRGMWLQDIDSVEQRITRRTVGRNAEALVNGSIISRDSNSSVVEINDMSEKNDYDIYDTQYDVEVNHYKKDDFVVKNGTDLMIGSEIHLPTMYKDGRTLKKRTWNGTAFVNDSTPIVPVEVSGTSSAVNTISTSKEYEDIIGGVAQIDDALRWATVDNNGHLVYSLPNVSADPKEHPDRYVADDAELWFREVPIQPDFPS